MRTTSPNVYPMGPQKPGPAESWPGDADELGPCMVQMAAVMALLAGARACTAVAYLGPALAHAALFWQLWGPMRRADARGVPLAQLGLTQRGWVQEVLWAGAVAAVVLPLWAWGVGHYRQPLADLGWVRALPGAPAQAYQVAQLGVTHLLGVALPEELFWRGYVQPVLEARWPPRGRLRPRIVGAATVLACTAFALGHVVGGNQWGGLSTALPALLFAGLRNRRGSVVGAVGLHTACNVAAAILT